jgi:hypothetical protein
MIARRQFLLTCVGVSTFLIPAVPTSTNLIHQIPRPKFHIGQEVIAPWENEEGMQYGRAVIIGMIYNPTEYEPLGWWYLPLWTENHECPWMVGKDDGHYWHETQIKTV